MAEDHVFEKNANAGPERRSAYCLPSRIATELYQGGECSPARKPISGLNPGFPDTVGFGQRVGARKTEKPGASERKLRASVFG
jgi:hypothetical protein